MKTFITLLCLAAVSVAYAQAPNPQYSHLVHKADSLYQAKDYKASGLTYSAAFKSNGWTGTQNDRYNAACSWALAGVPDSAFFNLERIATRAGYSNYQHVTTDPDLNILHTDKRWAPLLKLVKQNQVKAEAKYNMPLVRELEQIYNDDQGYRLKIDSVDKKYGRNSKEMSALWATINEKDSVNLIKVTTILDKYGWLGPDVISPRGNLVLFLVIQHADKDTRAKYLPMMREAVKKGNAYAENLALMEDRAALEQGKKQIYGSQIGRDMKTGKYYIDPIEDEAHVNERRASVGLGPLEDYVKQWGITYKVPAVK